MDGRRHSVDIPISKTLVALRRVRSLRDPSTNSSSKLPALVDQLNWETNSNNGINLGFFSGAADDYGDPQGTRDAGLCEQRGEHVSDCEMYYSKRKHKSNLVSYEYSDLAGFGIGSTKKDEGSTLCPLNKDVGGENKSKGERNNGLGLTSNTSSRDCLEGVGSCNETFEGLVQAERTDRNAMKRKSRYRRKIRALRAPAGDVMSHVGNPFLSIADVPAEKSSHSASLCNNEDVEVVYANHQGCGISSCWSRTPRFRGATLLSDVENQPLLSEEMGAILQSERRRGWKHINHEAIPYSGSSRSLCQKFRPKSFSELVGQNVVAMSLVSAISNERISSFYLFYGPRGTGKTSASRIFAAALNCLSQAEHRPCGLCLECISFFSGRSKDVKEVDSVSINRAETVRWVVKSANAPPVSSRFKVFIIDECHFLRGTTWATILRSVEDCTHHVVFIMITPDLDKLPRSAVLSSQRYHFQTIKEADTLSKLGKICKEEGFEYDQNALDFIAAKSSGSLRDAEMMLEQLSMLGKRITISLAYELMGAVSDEELLDLLDLALSSDTANTVRRAREMMKSRIDPMHLISQLANMIMDILSGKCLDGASEAKKRFLERHASEADQQQLSCALKILSETEKQLRTSKNQTTWLTVALLQLNSISSPSLNADETRLCARTTHTRDGDLCGTSYSSESLKHLVTCSCENSVSCRTGIVNGKGTLESIWNRATETCESNSFRNFLREKGKLASICFSGGLAVAELEFYHPAYVRKAEKSWKLIAGALQSTLGCNVEIRINMTPESKSAKVKKPSFSLFSCSRRMRHESHSPTEHGSDASGMYTSLSEKPMVKEKSVGTCFSDCGSQDLHTCCRTREAAQTIRNYDGNALTVGTATSYRLFPNNVPKQQELGMDSSKEEENFCTCQTLSSDVVEEQPGCFSRTLKSRKKLHASDARDMTLFDMDTRKNLALPIPNITSSETNFENGDRYNFCSICKRYTKCHREQDSQGRKHSKVHFWRTPTFPFKKAWQLRHHQPQRSHLVEWVLPCATAK